MLRGISSSSSTHTPRTPNALPLSCAAPLDRESRRAEASFQNRPDLARRAAASATAACWAAWRWASDRLAALPSVDAPSMRGGNHGLPGH